MLCTKDLGLYYYPHFFTKKLADGYFDTLLHELAWQKEYYKIFGKIIPSPRLLAWYGDDQLNYRYSGIDHHALTWTKLLSELKYKLESQLQRQFNSVLANLYRDGQDSMGWHADDESILGHQPLIASLSFGASRMFSLRTSEKPHQSMKISLTHGSLLVMDGATQDHWQHAIFKTKQCFEPRINLSFRQLIK